jgi:hypothetical protein
MAAAAVVLPSWNSDHLLFANPCVTYRSFRERLINHKAYIGVFDCKSDVRNVLTQHDKTYASVPQHTLTYVLWEIKSNVCDLSSRVVGSYDYFLFNLSYMVYRNVTRSLPMKDIITCNICYKYEIDTYHFLPQHPFYVYSFPNSSYRPNYKCTFSTFNELVRYLYDEEFANEVSKITSQFYVLDYYNGVYRQESLMMCSNKFKAFNRFSSSFAKNCKTANCQECKNNVLSLQAMCFFVVENYFGPKYTKAVLPSTLYEPLLKSEICKSVLLPIESN